jgi:hypothetical protein
MGRRRIVVTSPRTLNTRARTGVTTSMLQRIADHHRRWQQERLEFDRAAASFRPEVRLLNMRRANAGGGNDGETSLARRLLFDDVTRSAARRSHGDSYADSPRQLDCTSTTG